jgi:hypothetical protein
LIYNLVYLSLAHFHSLDNPRLLENCPERMIHPLNTRRISNGSLEEDQYFSAPSSRIGSRRLSVIPSPLDDFEDSDTGLSPRRSAPPALNREPEVVWTELPTTTPLNSDHINNPGQRWGLPFAVRHRHNPKHHHLCNNSVIRCRKDGHGLRQQDRCLQVPAKSRLSRRSISAQSDPDTIAESHRTTKRAKTVTALPTGLRTPELLYGAEDGQGSSRQAIEDIVSNIHVYLSNRQHHYCLPTNETSSFDGRDAPESSSTQPVSFGERTVDNYLVTTADIARILEIVITGLRPLPVGQISAQCLSVLLPQEVLDKPLPYTEAIVPRQSSLAAPATTVSSARPVFVLAGRSREEPSIHRPKSGKATIISRQSVTEVK